MRVQAIAKSGGLWMPWHGNLPEGSNIELDVAEVVENSVVTDEQNDSENLPILLSTPIIKSPDENAAEFIRLTDALFGEGYRYVPEKSDQEILSEVLSDKYA